ncbi:MAG: nucleotide exchange factor GrpE [Candidatus Helarchaeota archaeon]
MDENENLGKNNNNSKLNDEEIVDIETEEEIKSEEKKIEISESEYNDLKSKIEEYKKSADANYEKLQRAQADFENYKKILEKEKQEFIKYAEKNIISNLLNIIDEFEITLNAIKKETDKNKILEGINIMYNKFIEFLKKEEVKPIKSVGETFDPFLHEALLSEKTDEYPEDTVLQEIKKGYYLKDKVLRPALVKIAKNK